jgi:hypothetical protein
MGGNFKLEYSIRSSTRDCVEESFVTVSEIVDSIPFNNVIGTKSVLAVWPQ